MSTMQPTFDALVFHPVIAPTCEVDHGAEYQEGDPVYWNNQTWGVLDWDFDRNVFVLLGGEEWDRLRPELVDEILSTLRVEAGA